MSVRHCAATTAPRNCCPKCYAEQSHKDNVRSFAVGKQLKQKKSSFLSRAQHHLPALDLFWASVFVESNSPPFSWFRLDAVRHWYPYVRRNSRQRVLSSLIMVVCFSSSIFFYYFYFILFLARALLKGANSLDICV